MPWSPIVPLNIGYVMFCAKVCMNHEKVRDEVVFLKKHRLYSYHTRRPWKQNTISCWRMCLIRQTEFVTSLFLRELHFHTNSQCSRMCKGWLNTVHHPWFPWRLWSLYDNRIATIAVKKKKTLIPSGSKKNYHIKRRSEVLECVTINSRVEKCFVAEPAGTVGPLWDYSELQKGRPKKLSRGTGAKTFTKQWWWRRYGSS